MVNLVPSQYRNVSVADVPVALDASSLGSFFVGRPVYRRTHFIVARHGGACAVVEVAKESEVPLFSPVTAMSVLAGAAETVFVESPSTDTGVPTALARVAAGLGGGARCVVVRGRYGHVSFILEPTPVRIGVVEVVPPWPPKLADQLSRVLELAEDLPPVELVPHLTDLSELAATAPASHYLFPCRAGSFVSAAAVSYLDEVPTREPWTLVGCARSKSIHDWFYGDDVPMVDMCPRRLAASCGGSPVITKCCLLEDRVVAEPGLVVVPWGASLAQIREGLELALSAVQPVPR